MHLKVGGCQWESWSFRLISESLEGEKRRGREFSLSREINILDLCCCEGLFNAHMGCRESEDDPRDHLEALMDRDWLMTLVSSSLDVSVSKHAR